MPSDRLKTLEERTRYDPHEVEARVFSRWDEAGIFHPEPEGDASDNYSIAVPPPNVTGALHMGHALNGSIQDACIRLARMWGTRTKWIFGTDHAGIGTQVKVEEALAAEGKTKEDLGREKFDERVWRWREEHGSLITEQYKRLGASLDYEDEHFTMDEAYVRAVLHVFVRLFEKGLVYRDNYMVNWDPGTRSAISDLEVVQKQVEDTLYLIDYPLESGSGSLTVATVRPETMLADTAIAVNPNDDRYSRLIGEAAVLPLVGRRLQVIADEYVDPEFGTGALKITPGHDPNDFEIGRKHGLDEITVIGEDGRITEAAPERFRGMSVDDARAAWWSQPPRGGPDLGTQPYVHDVPHSHRSGMRIEPLISLQWFCDMDRAGRAGDRRGRGGAGRFHPENPWTGVYLDWLDEIRPWCISRQLWWGHQIPAWYRGDELYVGEEAARGRGLGARPRRARHLVLVGAVAVRHAGLARPDPRAARVLPHGCARHRARHHLPLGGPHGDDRAGVHRRYPLHRRAHPLDDPVARGQADVEVARHGDRPAGRDRDSRRRRPALRPAGDVLHPGRALLPERVKQGEDLANKLWNASRLILLGAAVDAEPSAGTAETVEDRWILSRLERISRERHGPVRRLPFLSGRAPALRGLLVRALRLVPRAGQAAALLRGHRRRVRRAPAASSACSSCCTR